MYEKRKEPMATLINLYVTYKCDACGRIAAQNITGDEIYSREGELGASAFIGIELKCLYCGADVHLSLD